MTKGLPRGCPCAVLAEAPPTVTCDQLWRTKSHFTGRGARHQAPRSARGLAPVVSKPGFWERQPGQADRGRDRVAPRPPRLSPGCQNVVMKHLSLYPLPTQLPPSLPLSAYRED